MLDYGLYNKQLIVILFGLSGLIVLGIQMVKFLLRKRGQKIIASKREGLSKCIADRTKYRAINVFLYRRTTMLFSILFSIAFILPFFYLAAQRSFFEEETTQMEDLVFLSIDQHVQKKENIKRTKKREKKKNKMRKIFKPLKKVSRTRHEQKKHVIHSASRVPSFSFSKSKTMKEPGDNQKGEEKPFFRSEEMPLFPNTMDESSSKKELLRYIYKTVKYPALARENQIEGRVIIRFIVNKEGKIEDISVLRSPGYGLDQACIEAVKSMQKLDPWKPGRQSGIAVNVIYTLPIQFTLE